jgi:hypothetical protein
MVRDLRSDAASAAMKTISADSSAAGEPTMFRKDQLFRVLCAPLLGVMLVGCGDESDTTIPVCTSESNGGIADTYYEDVRLSCDLPSPCARAELLGYPDMGGEFKEVDAARCVLRALRDRQPSQLSFSADYAFGAFGTLDEIFLVGGNHALANHLEKNDLSSKYTAFNRAMLKPASYFDGCLALTGDAEIFRCLEEWSDGCADVEVTCP